MAKKEKTGIEIERKYVIKMPDLAILREQKLYTESEILQIYLPSKDGETRRVRKRTYSDKTVCTETKKIRLDNMSSTEVEREISQKEFDAFSLCIKEGTAPVQKIRYTFIYDGQLFEIDVYPQWWKNTAIMETELDSRDREVEIPDFIEIIREVTGDRSYSNASMSKSFPPEDIF